MASGEEQQSGVLSAGWGGVSQEPLFTSSLLSQPENSIALQLKEDWDLQVPLSIWKHQGLSCKKGTHQGLRGIWI